MSGSTTPVSSAASYSDADVRAQSVWQAEVNKLKVAQLGELLNAKGVKPCLLYTSPSPRDATLSRMPSSA